jgi:hypothetical protein
MVNMTLTMTLMHLTNFRNPFLRVLVPSISTAFAIQGAFAIPSILAQSEQFYDLSGSFTCLSVTALSLYLPALRARAAAAAAGAAKPAFPSLLAAFAGTGGPNSLNWRQAVLSAAVTLWATRCMFTLDIYYRNSLRCNSGQLSLPEDTCGWSRFPLRQDQE